MNGLSFREARLKVLGEEGTASGIGTLSEKAVHKILKLTLEPDEKFHEINYLGSVADIMRDDRIYEIQTRAAYRLLPKLEKFLREKNVTVVFPVTVTKYIRIFDKRNGEVSRPKKSPKKESVYTAFREIYGLRRYLSSERLKIKLIFLEAEEYRIRDLNGKTHKSEKIPSRLLGELTLSEKSDYMSLVPYGLGEIFGSAEFAEKAKINKASLFYVMRVLTLLGIIECIGKKGNANIYKKV